jgi:hypothetical protein
LDVYGRFTEDGIGKWIFLEVKLGSTVALVTVDHQLITLKWRPQAAKRQDLAGI